MSYLYLQANFIETCSFIDSSSPIEVLDLWSFALYLIVMQATVKKYFEDYKLISDDLLL